MPRVQNIKKQFARFMDLPSEAVMNTAEVRVVGHMEVTITNHRGLVEYTTTVVRVNSPQGTIVVSGKGLFIEYLSHDELKLGGKIAGIDLQ
ncbi:MAG: hypothetical protein GX205_09725 [Firmicutes bacterium]|jgi:sporulation protein YqfC|nr:hypothetical protein [Bacillota bacterium]